MATEQQSPDDRPSGEGARIGLDRADESQDFVDTSTLDFDPDEGVYSGTAVTGTSEIPGPHLGEGGELSGEDLRREAQQQADEAGVDPGNTPAVKSPVARAAEQERADADSSADQG